MINKFIIILVILTAISTTAFSQNKGSIQGTITDQLTGETIPFANIALLNVGKTLVSGTVSNSNGTFDLKNLDFGNYSMVVSFIGFNSDTIKNIAIRKDKPNIIINKIELVVSGVALQELEIKANTITQVSKLDRKTYSANDFQTARGGTAVDVLNKIPSVSVSADGEVSVRGTTDFMVYLNGKPTQMDPSMLLGQISADAIDNIDVITVPSAKYDAQGKGGIININTKTSSLDGISVSLNGTLGGSPWFNKRDSWSNYLNNDNRYGGGFNLLYNKEKLSFNAGLNYSMRNVNGDRDGDARILDKTNGSFKHMVAKGERPEWYENFSANAGFDYRFTSNTVLSGSYFYGDRTEGRSAFYIYHNFYADKNKIPIAGIPTREENIYNPNTDVRLGQFHNVNLDLKHKIDKKSEITASILYEHSLLDRMLDNKNIVINSLDNHTVGNTILHFTQNDRTPLDAFRFSVDYTKELESGDRFSIGIQPQLFNIAGKFNYDTLNVVNNQMYPYKSLENGIELTRSIYAGYVDYAGSFGKLKYLLGLRLEYTDQTMNIDNPNYFSIFDRPTKPEYGLNQLDWFPTLHSSYDFNENNKLSFAANRRISRPAAKDMAPFLYRRHLEVYMVGDPGIKPQYISNVELSYDKRIGNQKFGLTGFYRAVDNALFRVNTVYTDEMVLIRSITNSGNTTSTGIELNANLEAGKFAKLFIGGSVYHFRVQGEAFGFKEDNSSINWSLKGNLNLSLTKELKFTTDLDIKSATVTAQGNNFMMYVLNSALNYTPLKLKKWNFSLKVLDILNSNIEGLDTRAYNSSKEEVFYQKTYYYRTGTIAELGFSYSLNASNGKAKAKTESSYGKSEF